MKLSDLFNFDDQTDIATLKKEFAPTEIAAATLFRQKRRLFVCDCMERALSIYEKRFPDDDRPRVALGEARRSVFGIANSARLAEAHEEAEEAFQEAVPLAPPEYHGNWPPALIARAAWMASVDDIDKLDPAKICWLILTAINTTSPHALRECRWQYKRLQWYIEQGPMILPPRPSH
jgi:hypothetical protein